MRRAVLRLCALAVAASLGACEQPPQEGAATSRFAAVRKQGKDESTAFCEKEWPAAASGSRKYTSIPERSLPGAPPAPGAAKARWKWVNLWATWCLPCVEEMGLLSRWKQSLAKDGIDVDLELWSVDDDEQKLLAYLKETQVPGRVRWLRAQEDLPAVLESLGAERNAAIPVHALVDGAGNLRCLRVGSVHDEDYGSIKALLASPS